MAVATSTALAAGGMAAGALGSLYGASQQGKANNANLNAQNARYQQLMGMIQPQMQQGQNPYAQAMMQFLGSGRPPGQSPGVQLYGGPQVNSQLGIGSTPFGGAGGYMGGRDPSQMQLEGEGGMGVYGGGGQLGGMYNYTNPAQGAYSAQANQINLGQLPQVSPQNIQAPGAFNYGQLGAPGAFDFNSITAPGAGDPNTLMTGSVQAPDAINPGSVGAPGTITTPGVTAQNIDLGAVGSSGFNTGQDALMQMLNKGVGGGQDSDITAQLNKFMGGGTQFDTSSLLESLRPGDNQLINDQVAALHGSSGSLGQRLGSSMMDAESRMRGTFANEVGARNAGINQQSFESAQGRAGQALGLATGREQYFAGLPMQQQALQLQAAQGLTQSGLGSSDILARLMQTNAGNQLAASQANAGNQLQAGLQGQQLGQQAGQFNVGNQFGAQQLSAQQQMQAALANQQAGMQTGQFNIGNQMNAQQFGAGQNMQAQLANLQAQMQAGLQGQQLGQQAGQFNIGNQFNAGQFGAQQQMQASQGNQQAQLQAMLANQGLMGQGMFQNANILNNMGQFNAQQGLNQQQFGAQQGNIYNQMMMSGMGQAAGFQNQQGGLNAQLLSILAGQPVGQQQPNQWGQTAQDAGMMAMLPWLMNQGGR